MTRNQDILPSKFLQVGSGNFSFILVDIFSSIENESSIYMVICFGQKREIESSAKTVVSHNGNICFLFNLTNKKFSRTRIIEVEDEFNGLNPIKKKRS